MDGCIGTVQDIHYGDILIKYSSIIDVESDDIPFIAYGKESKRTTYLRDGDVIIADTAEDETVGKCCEIININDAKVESGLHTMPCRPLASFVPMFLGYYMNSQYYHKQLFPLMQGVKVLSISKSNIGKTQLSAPSSHFEQKKIVGMLHLIDRRISKQQQIIEVLKKYKRGLIKLVFEKVMSEAHYQLPLSDLCISISSGRTTVNDPNGKYPLFGSTGVVGMTNTIEYDGDIVMVARVGANAGKVNFFSGRCGVTDNTLVICVKENTIHPKFLAYFLENFNLHKLIFGSGQPLVTGGQLKKIQSPVIAYNAQLSITRSLESLNRIIETHDTYVAKLTQLKSGLMQQLFI